MKTLEFFEHQDHARVPDDLVGTRRFPVDESVALKYLRGAQGTSTGPLVTCRGVPRVMTISTVLGYVLPLSVGIFRYLEKV